jgi:hypothetical protein
VSNQLHIPRDDAHHRVNGKESLVEFNNHGMSIHCLVIGLIETTVNNLHPLEKQAEEFEKAVTRRLEQVNVEAERDICWT